MQSKVRDASFHVMGTSVMKEFTNLVINSIIDFWQILNAPMYL